MATQEDRSLSSGMSLPQWMKTKMNDKLDFEQSAFSPTELDESFMFYFRSKPSLSKECNNEDNKIPVSTTTTTSLINNKKTDFSKHTPYCQKFLHNSIESTSAQLVKFPSATKTKSSGVDDGFKGEAALCGTSVIRVAQQMVSGKAIRGFNLEKPSSNDCENTPEGFNPALRRGSKSLPSSPLGTPSSSPKSNRRINKYFTGPFVDTENHGNWILSNLLSKRQALSQSSILEEGLDLTTNTSSQPSSGNDISAGVANKKSQIFVPKASELREMNFWSPTSM